MKPRPRSDSPNWRARHGRSLNAPFIPYMEDRLTSPAWAAAPDFVRRLLARLEVEHLRHGGSMNGRLAVSHSQFAAPDNPNRIREQTVKLAIRIAEALGFLEVTRVGSKSFGGHTNPSNYRLTYVWGRSAGKRADPTDEWRRFGTFQDAEAAVQEVRAAVDREKVARRARKSLRKDLAQKAAAW